ncbi:methyl-accepting chemotaxis protein [Aquabacterium sp. OR-4]|uniref:methyl-accepting chemotaxis protein n=1 Tax=Aquabacterium sp. OR-4 TaxID=2978127 RepID=UPI0021B2EE1B|nr:methyl-accepting chemotaxis protein [Aquabacterium sp. OR-4]MDT7835387.1 methyl-accepting chemotaxis protein [Aquabacterium sp. OR-4]
MTSNRRGSRLLRPGVRWMRRMRLSVKLGLAAALVAVPLVLLLALQVMGQFEVARVAASEQQGVRVVGPLQRVSAALHQLAALHQRRQSGEAGLDDARTQARTRLGEAVAELDRQVQATGLFDAATLWQPHRDGLRQLAAGQAGEATAAAQVAAMMQMLQMVSERSGLILDPQADTYELMLMATQRTAAWAGNVAGVQARAALLATTGTERAEARTGTQWVVHALERQLDAMRVEVEALTRAGEPPPASWQPGRASSERLAGLATQAFAEAAPPEARPAFLAAADAAMADALRVGAEVAQRLDGLLDERAAQARRNALLLCLLCLLALAAVAYLGMALVQSTLQTLSVLDAGMRAVADGDLAHTVDVKGADELAQVGQRVERMSERLSSLVAEIRSSAVRVGQAGQAVAEDGQALAQRTERQASSLRESVGAVDRLSQEARAHAEAAQTLDTLTNHLREHVEAGGRAMGETVESVRTLEVSARRVAEINGVIDDIAFQTNLLALNASIEAAKAGEAGRGFSVVAAEVRKLAQRCAEAAAEVRELIEQTTTQVGDASVRIQEASGLLDTMAGSAQEVSQRLRSMAEASVEQSHGLEAVSQGVAALDDITRENAVAVERSAQAAKTLSSQAEALRLAVSSMRLRQGTADEAREMVERALMHAQEVGVEVAMQVFNTADGPWVDRDMFLFVFDRGNRYRVAGGRPELLGKVMHELPGISFVQAEHFLKVAWEAFDAGSGWIEYEGPHPQDGRPTAKTAFVAALSDDMFIGCGVYRQGSQAVGASTPAALTTA